MQISLEEVIKLDRQTRAARQGAPPMPDSQRAEPEIDPEAVFHRAQQIAEMEDDPLRERRIMELAARIEAGEYHVEAEQIVDMAIRRGAADRAVERD